MIWSISAHKTFKRCPRQWFYKNILSDGRVKKVPERIEATRLSRLKTIDAWRGQIVDRVLSEILVRKIRQKENVSFEYLLSFAKSIFDRQLQLEIISTNEDINYQIELVDTEYGKEISTDKKQQAWLDIELALKNVLQNKELIIELKDAELLFPQRPLTFTYEGTTIQAIPDLIAFYSNKPPKIFDWKVQTFGTHPNEEQLILYALALKNCNPHKDFPKYLDTYTVQDIRLTEVQLIANDTGYLRNYKATEEKVQELSEIIAYSRLQMYGANQEKKYNETSADVFETAFDPDDCFNCGFKKLCKQVIS
jgi:hypothetical protein